MAACADGSVQVYDRERDIQPYEKAKEKGKEKEGAENAWNKQPPDRFYQSVPDVSGRTGTLRSFVVAKSSKHPSRRNPVSHYQVGGGKAVKALAFSPDCEHVAIVGVDGCLRIVDFVNDVLVDLGTHEGGRFCLRLLEP
ncbi:MAG: hypothetical protein BJ554DRAFT_7453 [Olpidium bornovanus]|uniref:Uncharacterized protein n=1 Tax=Olpidium bornovanus TaxID=278681 RepID=A0A8H7ZW61_9FUNG|nr:MAG: hypothetical protein BJ554DRAFT_7453 [Olpidium bornovanus]